MEYILDITLYQYMFKTWLGDGRNISVIDFCERSLLTPITGEQNPDHNIECTHFCRQKLPNYDTHVESVHKPIVSLNDPSILGCVSVCVSKQLRLQEDLQCCAWLHLNRIGNSIIVVGSGFPGITDASSRTNIRVFGHVTWWSRWCVFVFKRVEQV